MEDRFTSLAAVCPGGAGGLIMTGDVPDTRLIKQSLALRAKYITKREDLAGGMRNLYAWQIVPHPKAWGGEPIRSSWTKALAGDILYNGYDPREATVDSVVVEVAVDSTGAPMTTFAEHFHANAGLDPDHYNDPDVVIGFAGLNHNSLNLTERNILKGMPGCNCKARAFSLAHCTCHAKPILEEEDGRRLVYSMSKLREVDKDWHSAILGGRTWEVLSSDMDIEEPTAAGIIAKAFNAANKVALVTGHLEMMRTMKSLIKPDPHTLDMPWATVKASMVKAFGNAVLHDSFKYAFQLMLTSGGSESTTWADFFEWAGHYVDESKRMIRLESYKILAEYPLAYRNVVKMHMKTMWLTKTQKGGVLCDPPTSIAHRLKGEGAKFALPKHANFAPSPFNR